MILSLTIPAALILELKVYLPHYNQLAYLSSQNSMRFNRQNNIKQYNVRMNRIA